MKVLVLENGFEMDMDEEIKDILKERNIEYDFMDVRELFYPNNRATTVDFFRNLPDGQEIYCATVFDGFMQLELFAQLFNSITDRSFTFRISNSILPNKFDKFLNAYESTLAPDTEEYDDSPNLRQEFKEHINKQFLGALTQHNVYWLGWDEDILLKNAEDIKSNLQ